MSRVAIRGGVPKKWDVSTARHITERLQALERALVGGQITFTSPSIPSFGPRPPSTPGPPPPTPPPGGVTDHGQLTGLEDPEDHPQHLLYEDLARPEPHVHGPNDVVGLEEKHPLRGENFRPEPHIHAAAEIVGLEERHPLRGETNLQAHSHVLSDLADYSQWEMSLWQRIHEGLYGG